MKKATAILLVVCLLTSGMVSGAHAARIQSTELSPEEAHCFAQAQELAAADVDTQTGGNLGGALAIIGIVAIAAVLIAAAN